MNAKGVFDLSFYIQMVGSDPMGSLKGKIITNDCRFDDDGRFFVLTGANNGGKTTYTRAIGIIQVFAQAGIYVPCTECEISPVDFIYTHFPKEEEVGLNTSRFTQECKQFKETVDTATRYSQRVDSVHHPDRVRLYCDRAYENIPLRRREGRLRHPPSGACSQP